MLPNVPPKLFSISAVVVGYILIDDLTANEQNALGNWLMLVAQVLSTNAFYRNVMQERGLEIRESRESDNNANDNNDFSTNKKNNFDNLNSKNDIPNQSYENINTNKNISDNDTVVMMQKMIYALQKEVNEIKKNSNYNDKFYKDLL